MSDGTLFESIGASSETQGQSVGSGEKAGRKFSSTGERALSPVLENIRPALSPDPTDCPWVSEDGVRGVFHIVILNGDSH